MGKGSRCHEVNQWTTFMFIHEAPDVGTYLWPSLQKPPVAQQCGSRKQAPDSVEG